MFREYLRAYLICFLKHNCMAICTNYRYPSGFITNPIVYSYIVNMFVIIYYLVIANKYNSLLIIYIIILCVYILKHSSKKKLETIKSPWTKVREKCETFPLN